MTIKEITQHLTSEDRYTLKFRAKRAKLLMKIKGDPAHLLLPGGMTSVVALNEMELCFINGFDLSCIILSQLFLENIWGSYLSISGVNINGIGFSQILNKIRKEEWITEEEYNFMTEIRERRNPYMHVQSFESDKNPTRRALNANIAFERMLEQDAEESLNIVFKIISRYPFSFAGEN